LWAKPDSKMGIQTKAGQYGERSEEGA